MYQTGYAENVQVKLIAVAGLNEAWQTDFTA